MAEYIKPEKDRYIKLSQALEVLDSCACWWAHDRMERIPAADVRENVKAEWKPIKEQFYNRRETRWEEVVAMYVCPICGNREKTKYPFCNCGAQMGGAEDG